MKPIIVHAIAKSLLATDPSRLFRSLFLLMQALILEKTIGKIDNRYELHHIVAQNARKAQEARDVLKYVEIGINSSDNTVLLKYVLHKVLHTDLYYSVINYEMRHAGNITNSSEPIEIKKVRVKLSLLTIKVLLLEINSVIL
jgi:hypothetical protein